MLEDPITNNNLVRNKLNILHIVQYDFEIFKGGIQRYVKELSEIQASKGYNVVVYSCSKEPTTKNVNGVTIKRFNYLEVFRTPISISMILSLLKEERFDIIHIHAQFPLVAELITLIAWLRRIPTVITYHNEVELTNMSFVTRLAYKIWSITLLKIMLYLSKIIIVTTREFALTSSILSNNKYKDKIHIIPIGIFINNGSNNINIVNIIDNKTITNKNYILYVGRIKPEKGIHILIQAISLLKEIKIDINLFIIGEATRYDELKYKDELEKLVADLELNKNVVFCGRVSDEELHTYYKNAIALVLPSTSRLEGFGIVQLEAMRHGIPIIVSDIPGPKSVSEGVSIPVKPHPYDISQAILKVLDNDYREKIRILSLCKIQEYKWDKIADKIEYLYHSITNKRQ
jgi:rhamnosyl/mannosyltransferase